MIGVAADWPQVLSAVHGIVVNGEERITTHELLTEHLGVAVTDEAARRLRRVMRRLGWRPRKLRFGDKTRNGYWRKPGIPPVSLGSVLQIHERAAVEPQLPDNMADELALVARLGLRNLREILLAPAEYDDGPLLRAKNTAAQTALNAQLRADENRLQQPSNDDVLARVIKLIAEEDDPDVAQRLMSCRQGVPSPEDSHCGAIDSLFPHAP
jgi:hypothetical protein